MLNSLRVVIRIVLNLLANLQRTDTFEFVFRNTVTKCFWFSFWQDAESTVSGPCSFPVSCVPCICNLAFVFEFYLSFLYKGVILLVLQKQERILMLFVTLFLNMFTKVRKWSMWLCDVSSLEFSESSFPDLVSISV